MQSTLRIQTTVLPGGRIEIRDPSLPAGARAEVIVRIPDVGAPVFESALAFLESLPPGPRAFPNWEEYERHLEEERGAWDR
jgi:hypothetical protein